MLFYQEVSSHPNASQVMILKNPAGSVAQSDGFSTLRSKISLRLVHVAFLALSTKSGLSVSYTYICLYIFMWLYVYICKYVYVDHINAPKKVDSLLWEHRVDLRWPYARTTHVPPREKTKKSFETRNQWVKNILHTRKRTPNRFWLCFVRFFLTPAICFYHVFSSRVPWLSQVGDSLEPLKAIGFSPPPREASTIFLAGSWGKNF